MIMMRPLMLSTGVVLMAVILKLSLPVILDILTNDIPSIWSTFSFSWLQPPFLYVLINCIILSIVASSKFQPRGGSAPVPDKSDVAEEREFEFVSSVLPVVEVPEVPEEVKEVVFGYSSSVSEVAVAESGGDVVDKAIELLETPEKMRPAVEVEAEKLRFSARFSPRKGVKASPEGKTVLKKVTRPKRKETLESTWRAITVGRSMPLTRHLRKSDTFKGASQEASPPPHLMKKSDTFSYGDGVDNPSSGSSGGGKLRREPSLSQDDLNRRVEAFIKKFNEEMRLQRQQSFNQSHQETRL